MLLNNTILDINIDLALKDVPTFDGMNFYRDVSVTETLPPPDPED